MLIKKSLKEKVFNDHNKIGLFAGYASFAIMVAPLLVENTACVLLWGEPKVPDCLKQSKR